MSAWKKSPPELIALFDAVLSREPRAERRQMFGYPAAFVNGNLFTGLHQNTWMVRLGEKDRAALAAQGGRPFEPMAGRPMREYVVFPAALLSEPRTLARWVKRAFEHGAALPPKQKAARAKPAEKRDRATPRRSRRPAARRR